MHNQKKDRAIIFIANQQYSFALSSMLINLKEQLNLDYQVVVYHFGIPGYEQLALSKIESTIKFIEYTYEDWLQEHNTVDKDSRALNSFVNRFTHLALSKYKIFEQLEYYHQALYLDLDMLIQDDISDIFDIQGIAWRTEAEFHKKFGNKENRPKTDGLTKVPDDFPAPNGGLVFVSDIADWKSCLNDGREFINKYAGYFGSVVDELSISWIAYKNDLSIHELDFKIYNTLPKVANERTKIVHFMGKQKTWNNDLLSYGFPTWYRNYMKAIKIANYNFSGVIEAEPHGQIYRKIANQNRWLKFLSHPDLNIPDLLNINYDLSTEKLYLKFNSRITYFVTLNHNNNLYSVSLFIDNNYLLSDKALLLEIDQIVSRNEDVVTLRKLGGSLYLNSKWINEAKVFSFFDYFFKLTQPILNLL